MRYPLIILFLFSCTLCIAQTQPGYHNNISKDKKSLREKMALSFFSKMDSNNVLKKSDYDTIFVCMFGGDSINKKLLYYYINGKLISTKDTIENSLEFSSENGHVDLLFSMYFFKMLFTFNNVDNYYGEVQFGEDKSNEVFIKEITYKWPKHLDSIQNYFKDFRADTAGRLGLRRKYQYAIEYKGLSKQRVLKLLGKPNAVDTTHYKNERVQKTVFTYDLGADSEKNSSGEWLGSIHKMYLYLLNNKVCEDAMYPINIWVKGKEIY